MFLYQYITTRSSSALFKILFLFIFPVSVCQSWMKDVLYSLKSGMHHPSNALRRKLFDLITTTTNTSNAGGEFKW